ncbi:MAG: PAS domain S-box protein [candidate division KSB1 bacterium]|nr:PAS domain S-box protein [candidate division KSB1 bacterium]
MPKKRQTKDRILLVEDNPDHARLMEIMLNKCDSHFAVSIADSGDRCLEMLETQNFKAIVLDYDLPGKNGLEILEEINARNLELPVIIVTGQGDEHVAVKAMKQGAYDYIIKDKGYLYVLPRVVQQAIEKYRLEIRLNAVERKYQSLIEKANDAIFIEDPQTGKFLEVNIKAEELTGYTKKELLNLTYHNLHPPEQVSRAQDRASQTLQAGSSTYDDLCLRRKDGQTIPVDISASVIDFGRFQVIQKIVRDIHEKKKLEQQILESKKRLQALFDGITDMISVQDREFHIVMANKKIANMCNTRPEKLIGKRCFEVYFQLEAPCEDCPTAATFQSKKPEFCERIYNGEIYHLWTYPMFGLDGKLDCVIEYGQIVTEQKRLEKQLIQAEKLATIGILSSGIAHELRNPLNIIEAARYYIQDCIGNQNPQITEKLETIKKHVRRASTIINNLLEFSRPAELEREYIDINQLIDSTIALIEKELSSKNITLVKNYQNIPRAYFGLDSIKQVLLNIIINAIQAMPQGGQLQIKTNPLPEKWIEIHISDTGCGIPKKNLPHIFSPFFTTKKVGEGTGLGLYISHSIIKREGGEITVESQEGVGTTFTIRLPMAPAN